MLTLLKLVAAATIGLGVLSPSLTPRGESCECKTKANAIGKTMVPHAESCECKAKKT